MVGDCQLPHPGLEKIVETYYSYAWNGAARISADYQFIDNPISHLDAVSLQNRYAKDRERVSPRAPEEGCVQFGRCFGAMIAYPMTSSE